MIGDSRAVGATGQQDEAPSGEMPETAETGAPIQAVTPTDPAQHASGSTPVQADEAHPNDRDTPAPDANTLTDDDSDEREARRA